MLKKDVDIGSIIKRIVEEKNITITDFSLRLGFPHRSRVYSIFNNKSIDTDMLIKISELLDYNFFIEYLEEKSINRQILIIEADNSKIKKINAELSGDKSLIINKYELCM